MELPTPVTIEVYNIYHCLEYVKTQYGETYTNFQGENYIGLCNYVVYCFKNLSKGAYPFNLNDVDYLTQEIFKTEDSSVRKIFLIFQDFLQVIIDDLGQGGLIYLSLEV